MSVRPSTVFDYRFHAPEGEDWANIQKKRDEACKLFTAHAYQESANAFELALSMAKERSIGEADEVAFLCDLLLTFLFAHNLPRALKIAYEIEKKNVHPLEFDVYLALVLSEMGDSSHSAYYLNQFLKKKECWQPLLPFSASSLFFYSFLLSFEKGEWSKVITEAQNVDVTTLSEKEKALLYLRLGLAYSVTGEMQKASEEFTKGLNFAKDDESTCFELTLFRAISQAENPIGPPRVETLRALKVFSSILSDDFFEPRNASAAQTFCKCMINVRLAGFAPLEEKWRSMITLARMYEEGSNGIVKNPQKARQFYKMASHLIASSGEDAIKYYEDTLLSKRVTEANDLSKRVTEANDYILAHREIAKIYRKKGFFSEAAEHYEKAATEGDTLSIEKLASVYLSWHRSIKMEGGIPPSLEKEKSAFDRLISLCFNEPTRASALSLLALYYLEGPVDLDNKRRGFPEYRRDFPEYEKALDCFLKASRQKDLMAQTRAAWMLALGQGVFTNDTTRAVLMAREALKDPRARSLALSCVRSIEAPGGPLRSPSSDSKPVAEMCSRPHVSANEKGEVILSWGGRDFWNTSLKKGILYPDMEPEEQQAAFAFSLARSSSLAPSNLVGNPVALTDEGEILALGLDQEGRGFFFFIPSDPLSSSATSEWMGWEGHHPALAFSQGRVVASWISKEGYPFAVVGKVESAARKVEWGPALYSLFPQLSSSLSQTSNPLELAVSLKERTLVVLLAAGGKLHSKVGEIRKEEKTEEKDDEIEEEEETKKVDPLSWGPTQTIGTPKLFLGEPALTFIDPDHLLIVASNLLDQSLYACIVRVDRKEGLVLAKLVFSEEEPWQWCGTGKKPTVTFSQGHPLGFYISDACDKRGQLARLNEDLLVFRTEEEVRGARGTLAHF